MNGARQKIESAQRFVIEPVYLPPTGTPLNWYDETSGVLADAVGAYVRMHVERQNAPPARQLEIVRAYFEYYVNAPCWTAFSEDGGDLESLRLAARTACSARRLDAWLDKTLEFGIDPL